MSGPSWDETKPIATTPVASGAPVGPSWDETKDIQEEYGGLGGQAAAAGLGALNTLTFGAGNAALAKSGIVPSKTQSGLEAANPTATTVGEVGAFGISHFVGIGEAEDAIRAAKAGVKAAAATGDAAKIAKATEALSAVKNTVSAGDALNPVKAVSKIGSQVSEAVGSGIPGTALGLAAEGAAYGAGETLHEEALGDPDVNAERLMHNVGFSALMAGGLGTLLGAGAKGVSKLPDFIGEAKSTVKKASNYVDEILADTPKSEIPIVDPATDYKGLRPSSLEEMQAQDARALAAGETVNMPQKAAVEDALSRVTDLDHSVHQLQLDSFNSQDERDLYRIAREMPGEAGTTLRNREALQKRELTAKTDQAIDAISPTIKPTEDAVKAGERAAEAFTEVIEQNRKELGPKIQEIKNLTKDTKFFHLPGVVDAMTNPEVSPFANPKLANIFDAEAKEIAVKKEWDSTWGVSKKTYQNMKQLVKDLHNNPSDFSKLFDARKALLDGVQQFSKDEAAQELVQAKAAMMDYIQSIAQKSTPDINVRDWFKRYAVNEQNANFIEKKLGAQIGSDNWRSLAKGKPGERILDNVFRNTETIKAARAILPPDKFNEMLANYIANERAHVTKDGVFSSNKFGTFLHNERNALGEAFAYRPELHQRIKDLNTLSRILPDAGSVNPSGTAKTLVGALSLNPAKLLDNLKEFGAEKWQHRQMVAEINERLGSTSQKAQTLAKVEASAKKTQSKIEKGIKGIFGGAEKSVGFVGSKLIPEYKEDHKKLAEKVQALSANPTLLMKRLEMATDHLYQAAPMTAAGVQQLAVRATQFLASKVPHSPLEGPLDYAIEPSNTELAKFERYNEIVENPVSILKQVQSNTLSTEALEAMQAVYPKMLGEMRQGVFSHIAGMKNPKSIPYQTKLALSLFMGAPLDRSLDQMSVASSQMIYAQKTAEQNADEKMIKPTEKGMEKLSLAKRTQVRQDVEA